MASKAGARTSWIDDLSSSQQASPPLLTLARRPRLAPPPSRFIAVPHPSAATTASVDLANLGTDDRTATPPSVLPPSHAQPAPATGTSTLHHVAAGPTGPTSPTSPARLRRLTATTVIFHGSQVSWQLVVQLSRC
ncbi:hypothetical protein Agub_g7407 [Astrephomene gubernaculifera]|uniref:Uncharacterized protein n=1 Tax=Astrephomene gubernaculifera TaxID=47775 RepID=A0AAD3DSR4_9CHLO|nr:hypothetical protein Agub_g7407 [Astrephomene gubernaculifera]